MTNIERLKLYKNIPIKDTSQDSLFNLYLEDAEQLVLDYCGIDALPPALNTAVVRLAVIQSNQQGAEHLEQHSYSGASEKFITEIPADIKAQLSKYRKLKNV